ncbi:S41 family peptidase [Polaribacter porphyrae]|uniref:Peptidase S41 n=1 Tax=Polaribacter porphyrae TaxID=1137780 RepID=A0A2S7WLC6_9FLAO|nr:S41 family peptidase [Polaribacter porphyrae]PQJ78102.1 peptidase S41 [Polaribacter porphyrae]
MKVKFKYTLILVVFLLITVGCSKSDEGIPEDIEVHDFVWKGLNAYYLWQSDIPNLRDTRFSNQGQLNSFLMGFPTPENLFESLLNRPTDRFSIIVDDYIALENSFQGITLSTGMEFGLVRQANNPSDLFGYVRYVIPNSPADNEGITRGMIFDTVDGIPLNENNARSLLFGSNTTITIGLANYNNGNPTGNGNSITLNKTQLQENPIAVSKVITDGTQKIGYLMYNQFASSFDAQLNAAFANFKSEGINDLVIDLRYNGGGSVRTATYLGGMVTGQFAGQLYSQEVWNEKVMEANPPERFLNNFTNEIRNVDTNGNIVLQENINSLELTRVYFIVTGSTASASELVINSLSSYIDVFLVGIKTVGKQVGSVTLYDSEGYTRTGANLNPNHTYAMQPIVLEISNKDNTNEPLGFTPATSLPGVFLAEDYGNLGVLGERSDPLLDRTLVYIATGAKGVSRKNSIQSEEIYNSKLATPSSNNMYVDFIK